MRAALAIGVDVAAFGGSNSCSSETSSSLLLWGGPVPGVTALHDCGEAGGDAVVLREPAGLLDADVAFATAGAGAAAKEGRRRRQRRKRGLLSRHRQRQELLQNASSSSPSPSSAEKAPPTTTLYVDGDMKKLLSSSSLSSSSNSSSTSPSTPPPPFARVFVGTSFWRRHQLRDEVAAGAWFVARAPPRELLLALRGGGKGGEKGGGRTKNEFDFEFDDEDDAGALWARYLRGMGLGALAELPEAAVEDAAREVSL